MAKGDLFVYSIVGFFLGIFIFFTGFKNFKRLKLIQDTPTSKIRSIAMGPVEIHGKAKQFNEVLSSPFTSSKCVYFRATVEELRRSRKSTYWAEVARFEDKVPFYVEDETGKVIVDCNGAEVDIPQDFQKIDSKILYLDSLKRTAEKRKGSSNHESINSAVNAFVNFSNSFGFLNPFKQYRYTEYYLSPSDEVYIMAYAGNNPFAKSPILKNEDGVMLQKGSIDFFYISDKSEKHVVNGFKWKTYGGIIGGALLTLICLAITLSYLKIL